MTHHENREYKKPPQHLPCLPEGRVSGQKALTVEALVAWTYADQRADLVSGLFGPSGLGSGGDSLSGLRTLGTVIDGGGGAAVRLHDDADAVDDAVRALPRETALLVARHGRMRSRPDWRPGARWRFEPAEWHLEPALEPGVWLRTGTVSSPGRGGRLWVAVRQVDAPDLVARDRAVWARWADGLAKVQAALIGRTLRAHRLTGEVPPVEPWHGRA